MAVRKPVSPEEVRHIVAAAVQRHAPVTLTCRVDGVWRNGTSRFLGLRSDGVWIEHPASHQTMPDIQQLDKIGIAFKQGHHKYVFSTSVLIAADFSVGPDRTVRGLRLTWPTAMHQLQRRLFERTPVPDGVHISVRFWPGGLVDGSDSGREPDVTYCGELLDLSAGGFALRLTGDRVPPLRGGDPIGASIIAPDSRPTIQVNAQLRHAMIGADDTTLGLQMMGLTETDAGHEALEVIHHYCRDFRRHRGRRRPRAAS